MNSHTRVCSDHFVKANGLLLRLDEVPSLGLPGSVGPKISRKPPKDRSLVPSKQTSKHTRVCSGKEVKLAASQDACVQTEKMTMTGEERVLLDKVNYLQFMVDVKDQQLSRQKFRLMNMKDDNYVNSQISFYTGFQSYKALEAFYNFLGPATESLCYSNVVVSTKKKRHHRLLPPLEELFLTLVRLRLGLMEQDLAYRFDLSQPTVSRIIITWINFMYLELKKIPLWPPKEIVQANMPKAFKEKYPRTRVIIDATEIYTDQPRLPKIQKMTFSNY